MVLKFFIFAVAFLISCTSEERDSVCDEKSIYYNGCVGGVSSSSSSTVPSSSSEPAQSITYGPTITYEDEDYETVVIGNQVWMAKNLNYNAPGSVCYNKNQADCTKYGRLYKWETAMSVCPYGWSLPINSEWNTLINYVGGASAGRYLKSKSGWGGGFVGNGLNLVGFSALPGGYGAPDGYFSDVDFSGYWWSSSVIEYNNNAYVLVMSNSEDSVSRYNMSKDYLFSVRCVKH